MRYTLCRDPGLSWRQLDRLIDLVYPTRGSNKDREVMRRVSGIRRATRLFFTVIVIVSLMAATDLQPESASAAPMSSLPGISIALSCTSSRERIRVTNDTGTPLTVQTISTLFDPHPTEPFAVDGRIAAGGTRQWQAGPKATGRYILTLDEILNNTAGDNEGVRVVTSAGELTVRCPKAPKPTGEKWIEVDVGDQHLTAWQGDHAIKEQIANTGKPGFDTPLGTYWVNLKFDKEDMSSCSGDECWNIPGVPWVMYFDAIGHAFHGVYWYNDFGSPRSHGCVNLPESFAAWLYAWTPLGTRVWIHE